ncbi:hypothetical protein [Plesiomonas shigelloides]|uniref:hypothetical protein n=1 Tax=Plesiomonas shigelloides TaxID=703 RepID=UPI001E2924D3|nr:hypothetical protein [Plesiomonas shigelloides]
MAGIFFALSLLFMGIGFAHSGWLGMLGLALVAFAGTRKGAGDFSLLLGLMIIIGFVGGVMQLIIWLFE